MSNISKAFQQGKAFIGFLTAGDPSIEKTEEFVLEMVRGGADLIEIGIPFSDPVAEGPVIQEANLRALASGTTLEKVFQLVESLRQKTDIPLVFLTYLNPVFNYGYEDFFGQCRRLGVDGVIFPDLPYEEKEEVSEIAQSYGVDLISLIAPTSEQRIHQIASQARGFLYVVSSMGVTGIRRDIQRNLCSMLETARSSSRVPLAVGFGINTGEQVREIGEMADGVIVGSAIVQIIGEYGEEAGTLLYEYVRDMKRALPGFGPL